MATNDKVTQQEAPVRRKSVEERIADALERLADALAGPVATPAAAEAVQPDPYAGMSAQARQSAMQSDRIAAMQSATAAQDARSATLDADADKDTDTRTEAQRNAPTQATEQIVQVDERTARGMGLVQPKASTTSSKK
jgi:hypothetical protein